MWISCAKKPLPIASPRLIFSPSVTKRSSGTARGSSTIRRAPNPSKSAGHSTTFAWTCQPKWPGKFRARKIIEEFSDVASGRLAKREAYIAFEDLQQGRAWRLEAGHITDWRTGAAGALGLQYLAGAAIERVAILGTGRIARTLALSCDALFDLAEIACTSRRAANRAAFAAAVGPDLRARLRVAASLERV